jgi:hypothetical protein
MANPFGGGSSSNSMMLPMMMMAMQSANSAATPAPPLSQPFGTPSTNKPNQSLAGGSVPVAPGATQTGNKTLLGA